MKVKELIKELSLCNPEDEVICSDSGPIYFIEPKPGYYDGHTDVLIRDEAKAPYYNIIGYKNDPSVGKVMLNAMNVKSCLWNCETEEEMRSFIIEGRYKDLYETIREEVIQEFKDNGLFFKGKKTDD